MKMEFTAAISSVRADTKNLTIKINLVAALTEDQMAVAQKLGEYARDDQIVQVELEPLQMALGLEA